MSQLGIVTYNIAKDWDLADDSQPAGKARIRGRRAADDPCSQGRGQPDEGRARRGPQTV